MIRYGMAVMVALAWAAASPARADIFTWVDKDGIVNVSNEAPPEGARVTKVVRTAPKDPAVEAAARQAEVRALRDKVDQLSREVEQSREALPPPYAAPPIVAMAPPAPAPTVVVTVVNQPAPQPDYEPASSMCDYTFGGCGLYSPGYVYYAPPFQRGYHKPGRGGRFPPTRPGIGIPPPLLPTPMTGFPGSRRLG